MLTPQLPTSLSACNSYLHFNTATIISAAHSHIYQW